MKILTVVLLLVAVPAVAQTKQKPRVDPPKPVYRTLDKMLKDFSRAAEAKLVATR